MTSFDSSDLGIDVVEGLNASSVDSVADIERMGCLGYCVLCPLSAPIAEAWLLILFLNANFPC